MAALVAQLPPKGDAGKARRAGGSGGAPPLSLALATPAPRQQVRAHSLGHSGGELTSSSPTAAGLVTFRSERADSHRHASSSGARSPGCSPASTWDRCRGQRLQAHATAGSRRPRSASPPGSNGSSRPWRSDVASPPAATGGKRGETPLQQQQQPAGVPKPPSLAARPVRPVLPSSSDSDDEGRGSNEGRQGKLPTLADPPVRRPAANETAATAPSRAPRPYRPYSSSDGYNSQHEGYSSQRDGYNSQREGYSSQRDGYRSQRDGYSSQREGYSGQRDGYGFQRRRDDRLPRTQQPGGQSWRQRPQQPGREQYRQQGQRQWQGSDEHLQPKRSYTSSMVLMTQRRQQQKEQAQVRQAVLRAQKLRVPFWVRTLAQELLQTMAAAGLAVLPEDAEAGEGPGADGAGLAAPTPLLLAEALLQPAALEVPESLLDELAAKLPPFVEAEKKAAMAAQRAQQQEQHRAERQGPQQGEQQDEQQQQQAAEQPPAQQAERQAATEAQPVDGHQTEQQAEQQAANCTAAAMQQADEQAEQQRAAAEPHPEQQAVSSRAAADAPTASASPATSAEIFAAELQQIMQHYQQGVAATQGAAAEETATGAAAAEAAGKAGASVRSGADGSGERAGRQDVAVAGAAQAAPGFMSAFRARHLDEGGFNLLLRAVSLMGNGMHGALVLLQVGDRSPQGYPTRDPNIISTLLRLANNLMEAETSVRLLRWCQQHSVPLDRNMWHSVLDVCAKVGQPAVVEQLMQEMDAAGLPADSVGHTILLMAYEKYGDCQAVIAAYQRMKALGLERNSFTYRAVMSSLAAAGRLDEACEVLDWMAEDGVAGNAVVYQILINAFLERDQDDKVDLLLQRMVADNVHFSPQAVARLANYGFTRGAPEAAYALFKKVRGMGLLTFEALPSKATSADSAEEGGSTPAAAAQPDLLAGISDTEEGSDAEEAATAGASASAGEDGAESGAEDEDEERQRQQMAARGQAAHSYCRMIAACHKARLLDEAWSLYDWMLEDGLWPDRATYSRLISVCAYSPAHSGKAEALYDRLLAEGLEVDTFMYLHLVTALGSGDEGPSRWPAVLRVLHGLHMGMPNFKDTHVQTAAITLAARHGHLVHALAVYRLMLQDGVEPKSPTYNALIAACMRAGQPAKGFQFFEIMQAMGVEADVVTVSTLISCCERMGDWRRALEVWDWMLAQGLEPDTVCYNTLIACMERCNQPDRALEVFEEMTAAGVQGSSATYAALCEVFQQQGKWDKLRTAVQVKEWMEAQGEDPAQLTYAQVIQRAAEGGNWQRALELFDGMESSPALTGSQPNGLTYSAAIIACARLADWQRALELKDQMLARGLPAQPIVYNSVLAACEAAQQLEAGLDVLDEMRVSGVPRDNYTYSTLMSTCQSGGHLATALRLFKEMQEEGLTPNIVVVNALLGVCGAVGDADTALQLHRFMVQRLDIEPDEITFHCILEACGRAGRWTHGLRYFVGLVNNFGAHSNVMCLEFADPAAAATLDLHFLTIMGCRVVLRAWLLHLKRSALAGHALAPDVLIRIVTGWGRNSPTRVARLRPEVVRLFYEELGPPLQLEEMNAGAFAVTADKLYDWLLHDAQLGYTAEEEKQALNLLEQLRAVLARQAQQGAAGEGEPQGPPSPRTQLLLQAAEAGAAATEAACSRQWERVAAVPLQAPPSATDSMASDSETM